MLFTQCFFSQDEQDTSSQKWMIKTIQLLHSDNFGKFVSFLNCSLCLILNHLLQVTQSLLNLQEIINDFSIYWRI